MNHFDQQLAIVTGGSEGIGRAVCHALAKQGCRVVVLARTASRVHSLVEELNTLGFVAFPAVVDLTDLTSTRVTISQIQQQHGTIDILINCAGIGRFTRFEHFQPDELDAPMQVPCNAAMHVSHLVVPGMLKAGRGSIINVASPASFFPLPYMVPYTASRWALRGFSDSLHYELKRHGVHVGLVCPGKVDSSYVERNATDIRWWPRIAKIFPEVKTDQVADRIVGAIIKRRRETVFPALLWLFVKFYGLFPAFTFWILEHLRLLAPKLDPDTGSPHSILDQLAPESVTNWEESIALQAGQVVQVADVEDIVRVVTNTSAYTSPIRAAGSRHSTTHCGVADQGTLLCTRRMDQILQIDPNTMTVTAQAGALYIDVAKSLETRGLQFFVNVEIGNLTMGSAACTGTKDASFPGEMGQVCSYLKSAKLVLANGEHLVVDEDDEELLMALRSSYGLFGVIYEVTFKIRPVRAMQVFHKTYTLNEFERELPDLLKNGHSLMYYLFPFAGTLTVEFRQYDEHQTPSGRKAWFVRNMVWKTMAPMWSALLTRHVRNRKTRYLLFDSFYRILQIALNLIIKSRASFPADQIIRYPEKKGLSKYTFSIFAFPEEQIIDTMRAYYDFCLDHYRQTDYRCDILNVGYRIEKDRNPLFSYSWEGNVMTLDPVCTANEEGWDDFLVAYNQFCSDHDGIPLFNQSKWLTRTIVAKAFGKRIDRFNVIRNRLDPQGRFQNDYFRTLFEPNTISGVASDQPASSVSGGRQMFEQAGHVSNGNAHKTTPPGDDKHGYDHRGAHEKETANDID